MLMIDSLMKIRAIPPVISTSKVYRAKSISGGRNKSVLTGEPKERKRQGIELTKNALMKLKSATAADIAEETGLTVTTARNNLNNMFAANKVTKIKVNGSLKQSRVQYFGWDDTLYNPERYRVVA